MFSFGKSIIIPGKNQESGLASLYPMLANVNKESLPSIDRDILNSISHLRIDPVNACNARCIFCHSDFSSQARQLEIEEFAELMENDFPNLTTLSIGCAFEPLMGKYFSEYVNYIENRRGKSKARIITNGLLLNKKDIGPWVEFGLEYIHISAHSHIPDVYEDTMRGGSKFSVLEANLKETRSRFPNIEMHIINVVSKANDVDISGFCKWAFDEVGVDKAIIYRSQFIDNPSSGMPASAYVPAYISEQKRGPRLTDEEWGNLLSNCSQYMDQATKGSLSFGANGVEVVSLRRP